MPAIDGQSISGCSRSKDSIPAGCGILGDSANAFNYMFDIRALGFHNGTASRRTASRIRGQASNYYLYTLAQELLEVGNQAPGKPRRGFASHVDKKVDIAFRGVVPASYGAEEQHIACAVEGGHPQDFVALFSDALTGAHLSVIVASARGVWGKHCAQGSRGTGKRVGQFSHLGACRPYLQYWAVPY